MNKFSQGLQFHPPEDKPRRMKFALNQLKIEQLVGYFNDQVMDLTPPFQRGRVWTQKLRRGLLKNILQGKPVPAIFLYKKPEGPKNNYVVLDGKQRLESILLFIGSERQDFSIHKWDSYIFGSHRDHVGFRTLVGTKQKGIANLTDEEVVKFRDYSLSIIEIDFDDETTLQEIIQLFVDINQTGVKVTRFDIVKALYRDDLFLEQMFDLVAIKVKRKKDIYFKATSSPFCYVLKRLDIVQRVAEKQNRIDLIWEKLCELGLYAASGLHRKPSQILKDFISRRSNEARPPKLNTEQLGRLRKAFEFVKDCHKHSKDFSATRWAKDQTHFYIFVVWLMNTKILGLGKYGQIVPIADLVTALIIFDANLKGESTLRGKPAKQIKEYAQLSAKQTTDSAKRQQRMNLFDDIVGLLTPQSSQQNSPSPSGNVSSGSPTQ